MLTLDAFGQRIRTLRTQKGLSQQQLADLMYVTRKTIGNWESGNRLPDISMLTRLARQLGVDVYELLDEMNGPDTPPNVIVVEDEPVQLKGYVHMLGDLLPNAQLFGFQDTAEALRFADANRIAVAFVDIELRGDSGMALARMLMDIDRHTNVIFLTAHPEYAQEAWGVHASGYLLKPLTPEKILRELSHLRVPVMGLKTAER